VGVMKRLKLLEKQTQTEEKMLDAGVRLEAI
jgi:hypothetical protein